MSLPGKQANPRMLQLWQEQASNKRFFDVCLKACDREVDCLPCLHNCDISPAHLNIYKSGYLQIHLL